MEIFFIMKIFMQFHYDWLLDMFNNDNIMTVKVSEVLQKVPTDEKDYHKCSLCVIVSL